MQKSSKFPHKFANQADHKEREVFVVDSNKLCRASLRRKVFESENLIRAGECSYEDDIVTKISEASPDLAIFSSFVLSDELFTKLEKIKIENPLLKIFIITRAPDETEFFKLAKLGIRAYCLSNYPEEKLEFIIRKVLNGDYYFDECMSNFFAKVISNMSALGCMPIDKPVDEQFGVTEREQEVLLSAIKYNTYKEIGKHLFISKHTVKVHLTSIYRKFNVNNKLDAILKMLEVKFGIKI